MSLFLAHLAGQLPALLSAQTADTTRLFRRADRAQMAYEAGVRTFAPLHSSPEPGSACDEHVGRYCLIYDAGDEKLPLEPVRLRVARDSAIAALERAFAIAPRRRFARPLVRDLVRAGRTGGAVEVARAHAHARNDGQAEMLLGFALHHDRQTESALEAFVRWLQTLSPERRNRITRPDWLLDPAVRKRRTNLPADVRAHQDSVLWRFADPLYLTAGNELLADHLARFALTTMKSDGPIAFNADRWGSDSEQILVRFGDPIITTRTGSTTAVGTPASFSEHWDPTERTYFPPDPGLLGMVARVDTIWPLDSLGAHSGHAPPTIRVLKVLEHQDAGFGGSDPSYFVVGQAAADSALRPEGLVGALFLLDSTAAVIGRVKADVSMVGDTVRFQARAPLPLTARFYSAEVYDTISRYAARARYAVRPFQNAGGLSMSGLMLSSPEQPEQPLARPVIQAGARFGISASLVGSGSARLELETRALSQPGVPVRVARWLGRRLGIESGGRTPALGWTVDLTPGVPSTIALAVDAGDLRPGIYAVRLTAEVAGSGNALVAERMFVVSAR